MKVFVIVALTLCKSSKIVACCFSVFGNLLLLSAVTCVNEPMDAQMTGSAREMASTQRTCAPVFESKNSSLQFSRNHAQASSRSETKEGKHPREYAQHFFGGRVS